MSSITAMSPIRVLQLKARRRHGLFAQEFYCMTPAEYSVIEADWRDEMEGQQKAANMRTASLLALIANCHRGKNKRPFTPQDFLAEKELRGANPGTDLRNKFAAMAGAINAKRKAKHGS